MSTPNRRVSALKTARDRALVADALAVRARAYAPYSRFQVGAALRTASGAVFTGCNVENASFGLTICAERAAVTAAVAAGECRFEALAIATGAAPPAGPCGACRQVLAEFAPDLPILLVNDRGAVERVRLAKLLPRQFSSPRALRRR